MAYRVIAGAVTVEMDIPGGRARQDVRAGAVLPDDVPAAEVKVLLDRGDIELVEPVDEPAEPDELPDGPIPEVLAWAGDDLERAQRVLDAEQGKGEGARKGIVDPLTELLTRPIN